MPREITFRGPVYSFRVYDLFEARQAGLIDSPKKDGSVLRPGTHAPVSEAFEQGEGKLLEDWIVNIPDALLIATARYQITVYRPKSRVIAMPEDNETTGRKLARGIDLETEG